MFYARPERPGGTIGRQQRPLHLPVQNSLGPTAMTHVSFTDLRRNMASHFDRVSEDREPLVVTRTGGKGNLVVISEQEFAGWQETVHLLSSPKNAARLMASIRQAKADMARERTLRIPERRAAEA